MTGLILSTVVLACGPLMGWILRGSAMGLQLLDGFVLVSILGLCFGHLLPDALAEAGVLAVLPFTAGLLLPTWAERRVSGPLGTRHRLVLALAALGLALHSALDGAALAAAAGGAGGLGPDLSNAVVAGIVIHRLPVGLLVWWALRPAFGVLYAGAALAAIAASTAVGYAGMGDSLPLHGVAGGMMAALVAGGVLHVILHQTGPEGFSERTHNCPHWAGTGALLAVGALFLMGHDHEGPGALEAFRHLFLESAPALLLGFLAAGLVHAMLPEAGIAWLRSGGRFRQAMKGMVFGLPLPICSCGVVPVYQGLVSRGAPMAAAIAFLVATPELGIDALLLSVPLLGTQFTLVRLVAAVGVALGTGLLVSAWSPEVPDRAAGGVHEGDPISPSLHPGSGGRLGVAFRYGMVELVDHTGPWILVGLGVAALIQPHLSLESLAGLGVLEQILVMTLVGMPVYVCASGATPIAAVLLQKGLAPGAVLAFLLTGPATNLTTFAVLRRMHGFGTAALFVVTVIGTCLVAGLAVELVPGIRASAVAGVPGAGHHEPGPWQLAAGIVLTLAFLSALLRQGPRGLLKQVIRLDDLPFGGSTEGCCAAEATPTDPHDGHHGHECPEAVPSVRHDHGCSHEHGCEPEAVPEEPACEESAGCCSR